MVFDALAAGHCFIGYDLPAPTRGFRFTAQGNANNVGMGDELKAVGSVTLQVKLPSKAEIILLKDGKMVRTIHGEAMSYVADLPGVYRVEAYKHYLGKRRGWIFSNPIYLR